MSLIKQSGEGFAVITLGGKDYTLRPSKIRDVAKLQAWVASKMPNPLVKLREYLNSPEARQQDLWAEQATLALAEEEAKARQENRAVDALVRANANLASDWRNEKKRLLTKAYRQANGPGPDLDSPRLRKLLFGPEGRAYELWLSLSQSHPELKTHWDVLQLVGDHLGEIEAALKELNRLNSSPDPSGKNSSGRADAATGPNPAGEISLTGPGSSAGLPPNST